MSKNSPSITAVWFLFGSLVCGESALSQQEIGFIEKFAIADDRREALAELIPDTRDYFYFHSLHYQNEKQLAQAQAILDAWQAKFGDSEALERMKTRQMLLSYSANPQGTIDFLRRKLNLKYNHAPPSRDRAAELATVLDDTKLDRESLLAKMISADPSLGQIETRALPQLLDRELNTVQLRALISRIRRADLPPMVDRIAQELSLKDSKGFGWAKVHDMLTLEQLEQLLGKRPVLMEDDAFIQAYAARLAPPKGDSLTAKDVRREYLHRLRQWTDRLPPSQNSFKALVLGNLLQLNLSEERFDRDLFVEYIKLPRATSYYRTEVRKAAKSSHLVELGFSLGSTVPLPSLSNDDDLVRLHLEHFLRNESVDGFSQWIERGYLDRVQAEIKILLGGGEARTWYAKLTPAQQQEVKERIEIKFAPHNPLVWNTDDKVSLEVGVKNVDELIVKIYEIDTLSYFRDNTTEVSTAIDLDGLVANSERRLQFDFPSDRRHTEKIDFPELKGRGVWAIDLLGGGRRSRALIRKGELLAVERLSDAGHVFRVVDENGAVVSDAHVEFGAREFTADSDGEICVPYAEHTKSRKLLLVDGDFACQATFNHRAEDYALEGGFLLDRQSLVAGKEATVAIHKRLTCNGVPISIKLLEEPTLTITATDADGIETSQTVGELELDDGDELLHSFLVPQRMRNISFVLAGKVYNQSRDIREELNVSKSIGCNEICDGKQIADFFLQRFEDGFELSVLGRNGEPIPSLPVELRLKHLDFKKQLVFTLATNENGNVGLGGLEGVSSMQVSASEVSGVGFQPHRFHRNWPAQIHADTSAECTLPLGVAEASDQDFSLFELRRNRLMRDATSELKVAAGCLSFGPLAMGEYVLMDHETGQKVQVQVASGRRVGQSLVSSDAVQQVGLRKAVCIRSLQVEGDNLKVVVDGADATTRLHVLARPFSSSSSIGRELDLGEPPLLSMSRRTLESHYVDALKLDEEYSYILERQNSKWLRGNMLPQPTLLINPWELAETTNETREAAAGEAMPDAAMAPADQAMRQSRAAKRSAGASPDWKCFDFLDGGSELLANVSLENGHASIPIQDLEGFSNVSVVVVNSTSSDSRSISLAKTAVAKRDIRLANAFPLDSHLAQTQEVQVLEPGVTARLGDPKTRRFHVFSSLADVFQLYSTALGDEKWDKFRFVTQWEQLTKEEKEKHYNEMACHELNFFLYHKDRSFFDSTVLPVIGQKLDRQMVDLWLLTEPLDAFTTLWQKNQLNTLERVLLSKNVEAQAEATKRWLGDYLEANPIAPKDRKRSFEFALRGGALDATVLASAGSESMFFAAPGGGGGGPVGGGAYGRAFGLNSVDATDGLRRGRALRRKSKQEAKSEGFDDDFVEMSDGGLEIERLGRGGRRGFFRSLDSTKEWAESQYYRVRLESQTPDLISPSPFWQEYLEHEQGPFLPVNLELPTGNLSEALCALALIDLPFSAESPQVSVEENELVIKSDTPAVVFLESIGTAEASDQDSSLLTGQEIYRLDTKGPLDKQPSLTGKPLLRGVPYRAKTVVTNPTAERREIDVLTQIPVGSVALAGHKVSDNAPLDVEPYSTVWVEYDFYFPQEGEFQHYGAQVNDDATHLTHTDPSLLNVLKKPATVADKSWEYVADWGSNKEVLAYLKEANLQELDLSRIAFRFEDIAFYRSVISLLANVGHFRPDLWAYAFRHKDEAGMQQYLQFRSDFKDRLGSALSSPILVLDPTEQRSYEHLDYKPLVVARTHQLGNKRLILNPSLHAHYHELLEVLSHKQSVDDAGSMQLCYYLVLQNRVGEAIERLKSVDRENLNSKIQYDYLNAYLSFCEGAYEQAKDLAAEYADYPVPRWRTLFDQVREHVAERSMILSGRSMQNELALVERGDKAAQGILQNQREQRQASAAAQSPSFALDVQGDKVALQYANLSEVELNFYLMDIELLFSRKPFVSRDRADAPVIKPNLVQRVELREQSGTYEIQVPKELQNKNLFLDVRSEGLNQSVVVTANALRVEVVEPFGQLQALTESGSRPVEGAYVKVYARHRGGAVRFFKDGYTDLRGRFDYATLSTGDLKTTEKLSVLILDRELGAVIREVSPPTR